VSGANQGLGLAIVRGLCRALGPKADVYLTARDASRGEAAIRALQTEGLAPRFHILDVSQNQSVESFASALKERHGGVDIVVSNAAARIVRGLPQERQVRQFVETNNHGTFRMLTRFVPLLNNDARFVVVASSFGSLRHLPKQLHARFDTAVLSPEDIEQTMDDYVQSVESGRVAADGWPAWINIASKVGQVATMRAMARLVRDDAERRGVLINAVCPGLVDTAASRPWFADMSAAQTPDNAARDVVWLATLPPGAVEPYGELLQHRSVLAFRDPSVIGD
jgi:carbonyl reductase 1